MAHSVTVSSFVAGLLAMHLLGAGCASSHLQTASSVSTRIDPSDGAAILLSQFAEKSGEDFRQAEMEIVSCVSDAIRETIPTLALVPPDQFRRTVFPGLLPERTPSNSESFAALSAHPEFRRRIAALPVRYLILVKGGTDQTTAEGFSVCGGYPYFACIAVSIMDRRTRLTAVMVDVQSLGTSNEVAVSATGNPWFGIIGAVPIGLPALTEARACKDLGRAIANLFQGKCPPVRGDDPGKPLMEMEERP